MVRVWVMIEKCAVPCEKSTSYRMNYRGSWSSADPSMNRSRDRDLLFFVFSFITYLDPELKIGTFRVDILMFIYKSKAGRVKGWYTKMLATNFEWLLYWQFFSSRHRPKLLRCCYHICVAKCDCVLVCVCVSSQLCASVTGHGFFHK